MKTQTAIQDQKRTLRRRVRQFYAHLNAHEFAKCYAMLDPQIRDNSSSVTLYQYQMGLRQFLSYCGEVRVIDVSLQIHQDEPSDLYANRDFAVGQTHWTNKQDDPQIFQERWVRDGSRWYTRSTGFVTPATNPPAPTTANGRKGAKDRRPTR